MTPYYEQSGVTIYHGDARVIAPTLTATVLLADPPYGNHAAVWRATGRVSRTKLASAGRASRLPPRKVLGNDEPFDPAAWLKYSRAILWGANHYAQRLPPSPAWLVWDKREGGTSDGFSDCEMAWTNVGRASRLYHQLWRGLVCRGEENGARRLHPMQKPVALMLWCLHQAKARANDVVLDPFMGSGSTLVAAKRIGLKAIGIELDEQYCEAAAQRLSQEALHFGETA